SDATGLDSTHANSDGSIDLFGSQAAINTALSHGVIYTPAADFSGADTLTVTANDQVSAALGGPLTGSEQIAVNVEPGTPDFTAMTLTIAQGATVVLSDANFSISDSDTTHFLYTVNDVTGGQFEVQHNGTWMPAPTGGFTTQQVEASQVEFVQDGTDTTPGFTIFATDGTNASATIAPTVSFAPTPPVAHDDVLSGPSGSGFLENTGTSIDTSVLLTNDVDVNGLPLTVTAVGDANSHSQHGGTVSLTGGVITYTPSTDYSGADSFSYTISDGNGTSTATVSFDVEPGTPVPAPTLTITVLTADGLNFKTDSPLSQMGSGTIQPGDDSSFTILDSTDGHKFVFDGSGFDTPTGGTISAIHELASEGNTAIADFTGLSVSATAWIAAVQQAAAGDTSAVNSLVANYTVDFVGGSGPDQIGSAGHTEIYNGGGGDDVLNPGSASGGQHVLTGGAGSDTFVYQQGYGAVTITDFDQGNNPGVFDAGENDKIELNGFSNQPNVQDDGHGNVTADFGNGDVLTFLNVTAAELNALDGSEIIGGGGDNGGNGNGPVIGNADHSITYGGPPILIDPAVTLSDSEATVSSVNVWISSGEQSGDQLTINGATDGTISNLDGRS